MWRTAKDVTIILLLTLLFAAGLKSCAVDAYKIPSGSMYPTLQSGDFVLVNKFVYGARSPKKILYLTLPQFRLPAVSAVRRGDVVVLTFPGEPSESYPARNLSLVKRCVGMPGDTIEISDGVVKANGIPLLFFNRAADDTQPTVVPKKGMEIALDSASLLRWNIFIRREGSTAEWHDGTALIDGKESVSYTVKRNYYFVLGDNINKSSDSREWGCVPDENILGRAMLVYWSKDEEKIRWNRIGSLVR